MLFGRPVAVAALIVAGVLVAATAGGLYRPRLNLSILTLAAPLFLLSFVVSVVVDALSAGELSSRSALVMSSVTAALVVAARALAVALIRASHRRRIVSYPTVVLGGEEEASRVSALLVEHAAYGLEPAGIVEPASPGLADRLGSSLAATEARVLIILSDSIPGCDVVGLVRAHRAETQVFVSLPLSDLFGAEARNDIDMLWDVPVLRVPRGTGSPGGRIAKRLIDLGAAGLAVVALAPVLLVVALSVRLFIGSPVLFRQERVGMDGRHIRVMKFRTITWKRSDLGGVWDATASDAAEINWLGRLLRATSLDELPQLFNVLRGDMSIVGPRPERPGFVAEYSEQYAHYGHRHRMPAGLTGLSQVLGLRGDTSIDDRARFDNRYIDGWSVGLDLRIMLRTVRAVLVGEGR